MSNEPVKPVRLWEKEFGVDYAVPEAFSTDPRLVDISWHNDICPSFIVASDDDPEGVWRIWVEHVNPELREYPEQPRIFVSSLNEEGLWFQSEDDVEGAIAELLKQVAARKEVLRAESH